ncbi:MAG: plasminogen-binding N-terminal domain-containing protein [Campylobacterota bacterium]|nr:plasminogen-binding N-terminal domain-containing protein [Campylobacterota bacterium]
MKILLISLLALNIVFGQINLSLEKSKIKVISDDTIEVDLKNLKKGQSGIVVHKYTKNENIILAHAVVETSNDNSTILKYKKDDIFNQSALPQTNISPKDGDMLILNHLYENSLLIAPNKISKDKVLEKYKKHIFLSEDFFASYLKLNDRPIPKKEDIIKFCKSQQIGTLFIVANNKLYILDSQTLGILDTVDIKIDETNNTMVPFFSKIEEIQRGFWDFGPEKIDNYNKYYTKLLELKK